MNIIRQHDPEGEYVWNAVQEHNRSAPQISPQMLHRIVPGHVEQKLPRTTRIRAILGMGFASWLCLLTALYFGGQLIRGWVS